MATHNAHNLQVTASTPFRAGRLVCTCYHHTPTTHTLTTHKAFILVPVDRTEHSPSKDYGQIVTICRASLLARVREAQSRETWDGNRRKMGNKEKLCWSILCRRQLLIHVNTGGLLGKGWKWNNDLYSWVAEQSSKGMGDNNCMKYTSSALGWEVISGLQEA